MLDRMRSSARWQRAVRDARASCRWTRAGVVAVVLAGIALSVSGRLGIPSTSIGGIPVSMIAAAAGVVAGLLATPLLGLAWHYWRAPLRLIEDLVQRVGALERARTARPSARVRFEYDNKAQHALLHVTNHGANGTFWAPLTINGALSSRLDEPVCAKWEHTDQPKTSIAKGQTCTLCLARLDLTTFPFAQWQLYATSEDRGPTVLRAMHTSVLGGAPDAHARTIILEVSPLSAPDSVDGIRTYKIALQAFDAERVLN